MIYFDMDGVLARWGEASVEETYKNGYFLAREVEEKMVRLLRLLQQKGHDVAILSHAYCEGSARPDKMMWLCQNGLGDIPAMLAPYGEDKAASVRPSPDNVLIDDFSEVLKAWEASGYTGIKLYNGINGTKGTWDGYSVNLRMSPEKMAVIIDAIVKDLKK